MFAAGVPAIVTCYKMGVPVIPVGAEAGRDRILYYSERFGGNVLTCTPSLAEAIIDAYPERAKAVGFKRVMCGAEPGAGVPEVKRKIEEGFGCTLHDMMGFVMGLMWVSCDLPEYAGMHYLTDDIDMIGLADVETGEPIPFEDGAIGQLVVTPLEGLMPPVRAGSGDVLQVFTEPCKCGAPGWRLKMIGRTDDMLKVKGVVVYPAAIDGVIASFYPRVTGEFRIVLDAPPPRVEPPLKLKVEYGERVKEDELEPLAKEIAERMRNRARVTPQIQWIPPNTLPRAAMKTTFIEKAYEKK
jgi:phenylacetate-CoA ligase